MRLPVPFIQLPLRVDERSLAAEVAALDEAIWRDHPEGAAGNSAVPLVAAAGDPFDDAVSGAMAPTPYLEFLPYSARVLHALESVIGRTRLMRIEEEGTLARHVDTNYYWRDHLRVHVPVVTAPEVSFECGGFRAHMAPGEVWVFDTWKRHGVTNPARTARVHLVIDTVGSPVLWDLIDHPERDAIPIPAGDGPAPGLVTESVNTPQIMSPWEVDQSLDALLRECAVVDVASAERLERALLPWRRAWRSEWARSGQGPDGRERYAELRRRADGLVEQLAAGIVLPNGVGMAEAVRQHVLRPALAPDRADARPSATERPRVAVVPPAEEVAPTSIVRPVIIVSSPRAGSTLLFETLARAPGLVTIGGESHAVFESIPALRPSAHGWRSNRLTADDATGDVVAELRRAFAADLHDREGRRPTGGSVRMLEKTPKNSLRVPFLAAAFPDATFVYLYRDPRETVSSMLDAWRSGRFVTYPDLPGWEGLPWSLLLTPGWQELAGREPAAVAAAQWASATTVLLDDLEQLDPDRWCVTSYDRLLADPQSEIANICNFCEIDWDVDLSGPLPLSRHTLDSPQPEKWRRNADELEPHWEVVREVALRAHAVFAAPPRIRPVRRPPSTDRATLPAGGEGAEPAQAVVPAPGGDAAPEPVSFESIHTTNFGPLLEGLRVSLLVSTYQSGRVIVVRAHESELNTHFRGFPTPMGMSTRPGVLAIGTRHEVLWFRNQPAVCERLEPPDRHDACFMPRESHTTGDLRIHDLAFAGDELWAVNTRFSCLVTFDHDHSFVPRWRPPFISALAPEDRCHLNGLAVVDGVPRFVTALGTSDEPGGWRETKASGGVILDVDSGAAVASGLCMPHSPRWYDGRLWVLESGNGGLGVVDLDTGAVEEVTRVPGFTRGLAFAGPFAFVGLSQVRESLFDGVPLTAEGVERICGVWVVDVRGGAVVAFLRFEGSVREVFDVTVLDGIRWPEIVEPGAELNDTAYVLPDDALRDVPASIRS